MPFYRDNVIVWKYDPCDDDDEKPRGAAEFMAWLQSKIDKVPADFRHAAEIDVKAEDEYGVPLLTLMVYFPKSAVRVQPKDAPDAHPETGN